jgi:hypothetical protein
MVDVGRGGLAIGDVVYPALPPTRGGRSSWPSVRPNNGGVPGGRIHHDAVAQITMAFMCKTSWHRCLAWMSSHLESCGLRPLAGGRMGGQHSLKCEANGVREVESQKHTHWTFLVSTELARSLAISAGMATSTLVCWVLDLKILLDS